VGRRTLAGFFPDDFKVSIYGQKLLGLTSNLIAVARKVQS
jgi:hypothetical protein